MLLHTRNKTNCICGGSSRIVVCVVVGAGPVADVKGFGIKREYIY